MFTEMKSLPTVNFHEKPFISSVYLIFYFCAFNIHFLYLLKSLKHKQEKHKNVKGKTFNKIKR